MAIWEAASTARDVCKSFSSLVFGDKQELLLQEIADDMKGLNIHIERLSETILYAVNLDGVQVEKQSYVNDLREIRQLLEPLQQAMQQPLLSAAVINHPNKNLPPSRQVLTLCSPLEYVTIPVIENWDGVPIIFQENNQYFVGWESPARLSQKLGYKYQTTWQPNENKMPKTENKIVIEDGESFTAPKELSDTEFNFEIVTVNAKGKIIDRYKRTAKQQIETVNDINLEMVYIPSGKFMMGSDERDREQPVHKVTIKQPFYIGKYPITQAQWKAVMGNNPVNFKGNYRSVETDCWEDAVEFCNKLSRLTNETYRLPSEAEWEYTCRAGTTTPFYFGETITTDLANYDGDYIYGLGPKGKYREETTEVGIFPPNSFGLYDMHGNVWEWCADDWHDNYKNAPTDGGIWKKDSKSKVLRGGSWSNSPNDIRAASRSEFNITLRSDTIGFRVVCKVTRSS